MPTSHTLEVWMALFVAGFVAKRHFEWLTGMTLEEWDQQNLRRIQDA